jgi:hypothetical protein
MIYAFFAVLIASAALIYMLVRELREQQRQFDKERSELLTRLQYPAMVMAQPTGTVTKLPRESKNKDAEKLASVGTVAHVKE